MKINNITDVHAHYDEKVFDNNRDTLLNDMHNNGISFIINSGSDIASSIRSINLAKQYPFVYASVSVFPLSVYDAPQNWLQQIEKLSQNDKVVAIGEIGLDYRFEEKDKQKQIEFYLKQLQLAQKLNLPVVIHDCGGADQDILDGLTKYPVKAMIHRYFSEMNFTKQFLDKGVYLGIGPAITYDDATHVKQAIKQMDLKQLLLETDAPFLPTKKFEGQPANSLMIDEVVNEIARIRNMNPQQIADIAYENAGNFFNIK